jgi:4-hydroxybenzoate polyprenyltransferase
MDKVYQFFRLIRATNIVIVILSMFFFQYFVLRPILSNAGLETFLNHFSFFLLCLGVCFITMGGNIINDYFDYENDQYTKSKPTVLGNYISLDTAIYLVGISNMLGLAIGYYLGWKVGNINLGNIFLTAIVMLWLYSSILKHYFLIGNLVVASLSALVFVVVVIYEPLMTNPTSISLTTYGAQTVLIFLKGYTLFAFLISLTREIVKDAEDIEGDEKAGMKTLPIVLGLKSTNVVIALLLSIIFALLTFLAYKFYIIGAYHHFWYIVFSLLITISLNILSVLFAKNKFDYQNLSIFIKLNMLFGIFSMLAFYLADFNL